MINEKAIKAAKLNVIHISSNNVRHPVTKTFTALHATSLHFLTLNFHLNLNPVYHQ